MPEPREPHAPFPRVRGGLPLSAPFDWLRRGAQDLRSCGIRSLFFGLCFAAGGVLLVVAFRHAVEWVTAVTTGFMLLGPLLCIGLYELSRQREAGEPISLVRALAVWKRNIGAFGIYSLILIVIYLVWARASMVIFALFYQGGMPTMASFMTQITSFANIEFLLAYLVIGGFFALLVFGFSVVAIPLMLDRNQDAVTAMLASASALLRNLPMLLIWAALIVLAAAFGFATGLVGLVFTMPLVGHATWHAYRALIEPAAP